MARFAGSRAPTITNVGRSGQMQAPAGVPLRSSGTTTNAGSAAGAVSVGALFGEMRNAAPKMDEIVTTARKNKADEKITAMKAEADMASAGINAAANVAAAEAQAKAYEAQAGAAQTGGAMSAIGGIASAAIGLFSDETTKQNIERIDDALSTLRQLKPVTFQYTEEFSSSPERLHHGFIAQEFQKVVPDATYFDESTGKLCIDTGDLIGLLVRANQQLETRLTRLEAIQALTPV